MSGDRVQLVRIRNPHGQGEWNGEWSDTSSQWASVISCSQQSQELERSAVDDGCFWMELTKFVQGFSLVDVCLAHRGWHSRSFSNFFCTQSCPWRVCKEMLRVRCTHPGTLYVMALQPSPRGASIGRGDRKKTYKLGDVSVLVLQITRDGSFVSVVGGGLCFAVCGLRFVVCGYGLWLCYGSDLYVISLCRLKYNGRRHTQQICR